MTIPDSSKHDSDSVRRNDTKSISPVHPVASPPPEALVDFVARRLVADRKAVRDPARRHLNKVLRAGTIVATFRDPCLAPRHLFDAAVRALATRGRSGWVAVCAAVASLEPQALAEAIATRAPASNGDGDTPATEAPADTGDHHLRDACLVAVEILGAAELRALVATVAAPVTARPARATAARRTRPTAPRQSVAVGSALDEAPAATIDAPGFPAADDAPVSSAAEAFAGAPADVTLEEPTEDVPALGAVSDAYLEDALALLLASRNALRARGITLPTSFDTSRCDPAMRARAAVAVDPLLAALDADGTNNVTRRRVMRAYRALTNAVPAGRDPEATVKRARRSVHAPPFDLQAFLASRAAWVARTAPLAPANDAASPDDATDGPPTPANVHPLGAPLTSEVAVVRAMFRAGEFHGAEVALGIVEVAERAALVTLARALQARLNLDFEGAATLAAQASRQALDPSGAVAQEARTLEAECMAGVPTAGGDHWATWQACQDAAAVRIADIFWQADLMARRDAHVEVVARVTAVIDTALRWMVGREFGLNLLKANRDASALWEALETRLEVRNVAIEIVEATFPRVSEETFRYIDGLVAVVRGLAAEAAAHDPSCAGRLRNIAGRIDNLRVVREMRHRSFLGHRPNRVSTAEMTWAANRALSVTSVPSSRPAEMLLGSVAQVLRDMGIPLATSNPLKLWGDRLGCLVAPASGPRVSRVCA